MPLTAINIALIVFGICFLIQLLFLLFINSGFAFRKKKGNNKGIGFPSISVIICAKNEEKLIEKNLQYVLEQDYPSFEVIVVNDCSTDGTQQVLDDMQRKHTNLRSLIIHEGNVNKHGKKLPLTIGIKNAQYEYLVFTDADCRPAGKGWLKDIISAFDTDTEIVLGYGAYARKGGLVNSLIRMDTFQIGLQYLSLATAGMPYMGVGRNLAYKKSLFIKQKGFAPYSHIPSGDDDLFVNKAASRFNTRIAACPDCVTISEPKASLKEWVRQKRRHVSTAKYYKGSTLLMLGTITLSQYFFWFGFIVLLFTPWWNVAVALFSIRLLMQTFIYGKAMKKLGESDLLVYSPVIEGLLLFAFYPGVAISNMLYKEVKWKT
jgi:cellulose synthase/poly-beta-1,6-N-acetylglucosamine synthase-like glycosyltransferase